MSRTNKVGLNYFPLDVDFFNDPKIEFTSAKHGTKGEVIAVRLLCQIYRDGYYMKWNEDEAVLLAKRVGDACTGEKVTEVVKELIKREFFSRDMYEKFGILTSRGIQTRYFEATSRYKVVEAIKEYLLVSVSECQNVHINSINVDIKGKNDDTGTQKKGKGNKTEKETKKEETFSLSFIPDKGFKLLLKDWLEYKEARKESYKSEKSVKAAYDLLMDYSGGNLDTARAILNKSYANNWQGFFELKQEKDGNNQRQFETKPEAVTRIAKENARSIALRAAAGEQ